MSDSVSPAGLRKYKRVQDELDALTKKYFIIDKVCTVDRIPSSLDSEGAELFSGYL